MNKLYKSTAFGAMLMLGACSTIIQGESQRLNFATTPASNSVKCDVQNGRGAWNVGAPGSAEIQRSKTNLEVKCADINGAKGSSTHESTLEPWFLGNIILGGLIGMGIDLGTGGAWSYPDSINVSLTAPALSAPVAEPAAEAAPEVAPAKE